MVFANKNYAGIRDPVQTHSQQHEPLPTVYANCSLLTITKILCKMDESFAPTIRCENKKNVDDSDAKGLRQRRASRWFVLRCVRSAEQAIYGTL